LRGDEFMSKTVNNVTLLELLPENLRANADIIAASQAVDKEFQALAGKVKNCLTIADVDNASAEVIDNLAGQMQVDFYDQSYSLAKRRELVKNAYIYKYRKGTTSVVKEIAEKTWENVSLVEWFEYGGEPYKFKLVFDGSLPDDDELTEIIAAIKSVKNVRSHMDATESLEKETIGIYEGGCVVQGRYETITQLVYDFTYTGYILTIPGVMVEMT
jgi:phage tail P2-like protein